MTERPRYPENTDDLATQRLPRVQPPLPGSLDPLHEPPAQDSPAQDATAELSIDDLMGPAQPAPPRVAVPPPPPPAAPRTTPVPAPPTAHPASRVPPPAPKPAGPSVADRVRGDAAAAWSSGVRRSRAWLDEGDHAVIAATALVTLLLLIMIAVL